MNWEAHTKLCLVLGSSQLELVAPDRAKKTDQKQREQTKSTATAKPALTVLPKYSGLKLIDAVELIISDKAGEQLKPEQVSEVMYGEISGPELSRAKEIIGEVLWRGAKAGRWQHVPGQKGVYTLDVRIVEPVSGASDPPSRVQKPSQKPLKVLPAYSRMSFTDAVATVLKQHQGAVMTPEQVARVLYGDELAGTRLSTAQMKVNRVLWDGASRKKWRRLTGVSGRYTLDQ